jgi:hypothetical protein
MALLPERTCRQGVALLVFQPSVIVLTAIGTSVTLRLPAGMHLFSWCEKNLSYLGIETLEPAPLHEPAMFADDAVYFSGLYFTCETRGAEWISLTEAGLGLPHPFMYACRDGYLTVPSRVAGVYVDRNGLPAGMRMNGQINVEEYLEDAYLHYVCTVCYLPGGPLLSSVEGVVVDV